MITHLIELEGKYFLPVDKHLLEQAGISPDTPLQITPDTGRLDVASANGQSGARRAEISRILAEVDRNYGDVMRRLAE